LRINASGGHVLSVSPLPDERASIEIVDLRGDPVFTRVAPIKRVKTLKAWSRQIAAMIDESIESSPLSKKDIFRIGVLVHGVVDNTRGVVHWLATFPDRDVPVGAILEEHLKIPVMIDNDANVIARAEHWFGEAQQSDDFSMIIVDLGLNNAHYSDGMLWSGAHGINPEFGHSKLVYENGRRCYCGACGCLVAYASIWGIVSKVTELRGTDTPIQTKMHAAFRSIAQAARTGDAEAREAFSVAGRMLGIAAANMLNERDPGRIVIAAFEPDLAPMISDAFFSALESNTLPALWGRVTVEFKLIDVDYYRKGAAAMALEHIYRSPGVR
jgi:predicted NBD/HSP70 family sugar kinase